MKVEQLLGGQVENHMLPFFWQHGEDADTLRRYMKVIKEANCHAVCVESRPHPDFCGEKWWADLDVILDEAEKLDMQVWILDDSHFPTGYANGAMRQANPELARRSVYCRSIPVKGGKGNFTCSFSREAKKIPSTFVSKVTSAVLNKGKEKVHYSDDRVLSLCAKVEGEALPVMLEWSQEGDTLSAQLPEGTRKVYLTFVTRNAGIHQDYINLLDKESCRVLIDTVYEPHYARYKERFGKTIAGFFSDEPELGNGVYFNNQLQVGSDFDYPWSHLLEETLKARWGEQWLRYLPLLWNADADADILAKYRHGYMDAVTGLVEECFSRQIGNWCEEHGVRYIGHMIEDNNQHARMGASLGHYFRGLAGQHLSGIDCIGGQVIPYGEDAPAVGYHRLLDGRDGTFYHYLLGALAASGAAIDPKKQGNAMCEIFGNYGWGEGPRAEKYLADHFMVQGINYYVPHAFSPKAYPDPDCPPHFYAGGHNPQYRAFGALMAYMNRVCSLISGGRAVTQTAVLYHGDCEWAGEAMLSQEITRMLMEQQVQFHVIPADVFAKKDAYHVRLEDGLCINGNRYKTLIVPAAKYIPAALAENLKALNDAGCKVLFAGGTPVGVAEGGELPENTGSRTIVLADVVREAGREMVLVPENKRVRAFHYRGEEEIFYLVNEDSVPYRGTVTIPERKELYVYDAWENKTYALDSRPKDGKTEFFVSMEPGESMIAVVGSRAEHCRKAMPCGGKARLVGKWRRSVCKAAEYPAFTGHTMIDTFEDYGEENKKFSGFIAYESTIRLKQRKRAVLEITDAGEDVELFVNGVSAGIQVLPPFRFDITGLLVPGKNTLRIEVATTLERERGVNKGKQAKIGITGEVNLYTERSYEHEWRDQNEAR